VEGRAALHLQRLAGVVGDHYTYELLLDETRISVSLTTVDLKTRRPAHRTGRH